MLKKLEFAFNPKPVIFYFIFSPNFTLPCEFNTNEVFGCDVKACWCLLLAVVLTILVAFSPFRGLKLVYASMSVDGDADQYAEMLLCRNLMCTVQLLVEAPQRRNQCGSKQPLHFF